MCLSVGVGLLLAAGSALAAQAPAQQVQPVEMRGRIVRVDPAAGVIVIRTGEGNAVKNMEYRVAKDTRYLGTDLKVLQDGLRAPGFRQGIDVWYRAMPATSTTPQSLMSLSLAPAKPAPPPPPPPPPRP